MTGFSFDVTCPRCGNQFEHVADGHPIGNEARAVIHCATCRHQYVLIVALVNTSLRASDAVA